LLQQIEPSPISKHHAQQIYLWRCYIFHTYLKNFQLKSCGMYLKRSVFWTGLSLTVYTNSSGSNSMNLVFRTEWLCY
jgi:hypothetical protein